jgi:hypothetical protein
MKTNVKIIGRGLGVVTALALSIFTIHAQNLLSDPYFASGTIVANGFGGWNTFRDAQFSTTYTYGPTSYSMKDTGTGGYSFPGSYQYVPASAGVSYLLTGYAYIPTALTGASEGLLQVTFRDSALDNLGTVQTSPGNALLSTPLVTSSSPTGTWIELSEIATAPANSVYIEPFTLVLDANPTTVYFDDLSLTVVPEPASFGMVAAVAAVVPFFLRRRQK